MTRPQLVCGLVWLGTALALEARWTPNGDGPARFSKRYRDQAGIDDSRWTDDRRAGAGWLPGGLLPESPLGWIITALAVVGIATLLQRTAAPGSAAAGQPLGSTADAAAAPGPLPWGRPRAVEGAASSQDAREKREAFLRRFDTPGGR
eukprot:CAMPEP_0119066624 /NCGR_PEP_ID=MMETSP1178-20130426/9129_1 /TAXON_ID=33656 /ORGANISM="unid sp, Strain CCMP2000" /LENGTH=147 /DNA_ID=CAMNT_0007048233 /DNA_START=40 /DNA_END=483 /DNA_ORIENTATION=+